MDIYTFLDKNIVTIFSLTAIIGSFITAIVSSRGGIRGKILDFQHSQKLEEQKAQQNAQNFIKESKALVYTALHKLLGQIQRLNVEISTDCVRPECIETAIKDFEKSWMHIQEHISERLYYLPKYAEDRVFKVYGIISDLMVDLRRVHEQNKCNLAIVPIREASEKLEHQIKLAKEEFANNGVSTTENREMARSHTKRRPSRSSCCGKAPSPQIKADYRKFVEAAQ
ncbi:MAG: hypothetical protein AAF902_13095 [Chloroflexota bacterium]